jgi:hypothetical protein
MDILLFLLTEDRRGAMEDFLPTEDLLLVLRGGRGCCVRTRMR